MSVLDDCFLCNHLQRTTMTCSLKHPYFKVSSGLIMCDRRSPMTEWCIEDVRDISRIARYDLQSGSINLKVEIADWVKVQMPKVFFELYRGRDGDIASLFFESDAQMLHFKMMWWN